MKKYYAIYVPANDHYTRVMTELYKTQLSERFGGCTSTEASGSYINENGTKIDDKIIICKSFSIDRHYTEYEDRCFVEDIAKKIKKEFKQECVLVETEDEVYFV